MRLPAILLLASLGGMADAGNIILQSTTSTANSDLYDHLLPKFEETSGIKVSVVAVGTGQAIRNAANCDGDVLLVHARSARREIRRRRRGRRAVRRHVQRLRHRWPARRSCGHCGT